VLEVELVPEVVVPVGVTTTRRVVVCWMVVVVATVVAGAVVVSVAIVVVVSVVVVSCARAPAASATARRAPAAKRTAAPDSLSARGTVARCSAGGWARLTPPRWLRQPVPESRCSPLSGDVARSTGF
jgi:hypothetical protein